MNFKHLFFTTLFAASFGLVACDDSSSANSSNDNSNNNGKQNVFSGSGQTYCNVTTTAKSVTVSMALEGEATYTSTVTDAGSRYKTISSEYWYASSSDANKECDDQKKEAASWRDGSYQVSCSGKKIYVSTTNTNNESNTEFKCDVSRTDNSVTMLFSYKGFTFESSSSLLGTGSEISSVTNIKNVYPSKTRADYECESMKRTAAGYPDGSYQISCSDNTVSMTMIGDGDDDFDYINGYADNYCETARKAYNNDELDDMYEGFYDI